MAGPATVAIVDDKEMGRRGLAAILATADWLRVVAEGKDGRDAVEIRFGPAPPDLLLVNGLMPVVDGPAAIRTIRERERAEGLAAQAIVIASVSPEFLRRGLAEGADGAFSLEAGTGEILSAIAGTLQRRGL